MKMSNYMIYIEFHCFVEAVHLIDEQDRAAAGRGLQTLRAIDRVGTLEEVLSGSPHTAHIFTGVCDRQPQPDRREVTEARFFPSHSLPEPLGETTRLRIAAWRARGVG